MEKVHKLIQIIHLRWWVVLQFYSVVPDNLELSSLVFLSSTRQFQFEVVGDCYIRHSHHANVASSAARRSYSVLKKALLRFFWAWAGVYRPLFRRPTRVRNQIVRSCTELPCPTLHCDLKRYNISCIQLRMRQQNPGKHCRGNSDEPHWHMYDTVSPPQCPTVATHRIK